MSDIVEEFKLTCDIKKAYEVFKDGSPTPSRYVSGIASGTDLDLEMEQMAKSVVISFQKAINEGIFLPNGEHSLIPLRSGHRTEWDDILGTVTKAELDENNNLWITAELEDGNPNADLLYKRLTKPKPDGSFTKLGFSVGGKVVSAGFEYNEKIKSMARTFYEVALKEISVVGQPAYPTAFVQAIGKSVDWEAINGRPQVRLLDDIAINEFVNKEYLMSNEVETTEVVEAVVEAEVVKDTAEVEAEVIEKTEEEIVVEEEVVKTEEETQTETDDVIKALEERIDTLTSQMTELATAVTNFISKANSVEEVVAEVEKAEEVVEEIVEVEKAVVAESQDDSGDLLKSLLNGINELMDSKLAPFEARLAEIEYQPVDKSIAVQDDKGHVTQSAEEWNEEARAKFVEELQATKGADALTLALSRAMRG